MGCTISKGLSPRGDQNEILASQKIEAALRRERKKMDSEIVILLLGTGEAGKSTLLNQAKLIYLRSFTEEERLSYKELIHSNLIVSIRAVLLYGCKIHDNENFSFLQPENKVHAQKLLSEELLIEQVVTKELAQSIVALYSDEEVIRLLKLSHEYQLFDSAEYFFQEVERIAESDYIPNEKDCLLSRHRTTGVNEVIFETDNVRFRMVDVGGQRNERKKWIHYFQDATVVLFCIAISEYNQSLYEDSKVNRLHESLKLFSEIYHNPMFVDIPFIIFFNKSDIFKRKITEYDMNVCFDDYNGGCDYDNAIRYLRNKITELAKPLKKELYINKTCAANTSQMRKIYNCVRDIIFRESFNDSVL